MKPLPWFEEELLRAGGYEPEDVADWTWTDSDGTPCLVVRIRAEISPVEVRIQVQDAGD